MNDGEIVHQQFLLVHGRAGRRDARTSDMLTVICHEYPATRWPCFNSYFKALVHLVPGPNTIQFAYEEGTLDFHVQYLPLLQNPPLFLCILLGSDSDGTFDVPPEKNGENTLEVAIEKLRMAGYMWQAFCGEQMHRNGLGRRTFRLDESWQRDPVDGQMREIAQIHVIRSKRHTVREIRDVRRAQQSPERDDGVPSLFDLFLQELEDHPRFAKQSYIVAGLVLDSHWDTKKQVVLGHAALGGGASDDRRLGIFGSHLLHAWPRHIHEIPSCMLNTTPTDTRYVANDANESGEWWRALNIGMGAMLHEIGHAFTLPHSASGVMRRGYNNWNRTFMATEPGRSAPVRQEDEDGSHWHRTDIIRLRFHPAFRLPSDGPSSVRPDSQFVPMFIPLDDSRLDVVAPAGLSMLEFRVNGEYRCHYEYLGEQPDRLTLSLQEIKRACQCNNPSDRIELEATIIRQQIENLADVDKFLREHAFVQLPGIPGTVIKSNCCGLGGLSGQKQSFTVVFQQGLRSIRVHHGAFMDGFVFRWSDGTETVLGKRGGGHTDIAMAPGEHIAGFVVRSGAWVDGLQIKTNFGRVTRWFGGKGGGLRLLEPPAGYRIVGMYATAGAWMDQIGLYYKKV